MLKLAKTRREDVHMTITILVHLLDVRHHAHSIVATVVQPAHKRRYINRFLCAFGGSVHGGGLLLRKTKGHVHPQSLPWASISSALVLKSAKTSMETPALPTRGEIL